MADVKISALPAATTPLTGGEVLPIVQSSTTKQVAVSNLTAGLTGTASININGTVGATTPSTGAFTTLSATTTASIGGIVKFNTASNSIGLGTESWLGSQGVGNSVFLNSPATMALGINNIGIAAVSSTGLAVTGTLSSTLDATIYGLTVGRGGGAISTNTAVGASALASASAGARTTAIGFNAANASTATQNVAVGSYAYVNNTSGTSNTAIGDISMQIGASGSYNTGVGTATLQSNTGNYNTAVGVSALLSNTTASNNTAIGYQTLYSNVTGTQNVAIGHVAGYSNTATYNTFIGSQTGYNNTTGASNVFVGSPDAGGQPTGYSNTTGSFNTALGSAALRSNTTASNNTAVGYQAGYSNTTGTKNLFVGGTAGYSVTTGSYNTLVGEEAGANNTTGSLNTFVGHYTGALITSGAKNTILGGYNGNQDSLDIRTASNYAVISDGDGNRQITMKEGQTLALDSAVPNAGTGITFPATQSASSDANTLDDYEEGTWTPIITDTTNNATMASTVGRYIKIGRTVSLQAQVQTSALGSVTGSIYISGLPFAAESTAGNYAASVSGSGGNLAITAGQSVSLVTDPGTTNLQLFLWDDAAGTTRLQATEWSSDGFIRFSITYFAAS